MKKPSFHSLIKQELVNRFEDVVKNELRQSSLTQENNDKYFNELRLKTDEITNLFGSNISNINLKLVDFSQSLLKISKLLNNQIESTKYIYQTYNKVDLISSEFVNLKENASQKKDLENFKDNVNQELINLNVIIHDKETHVLYKLSECIKQINVIKSNYVFFEDKITEKFNKIISDYEVKINNFEISVEGYKKELDAVKKKAFIQEKYIEKIMTDLENMKNEAKK